MYYSANKGGNNEKIHKDFADINNVVLDSNNGVC
jgi:hypothetical protein